MTSSDALFFEIRDAADERLPMLVRYSRLYALLEKVCAEQSADFKTDYSGLFSRLFAVCRARKVSHLAADRFRRHARQVLQLGQEPQLADFRQDVTDFCSFVQELYGCSLPDYLLAYAAPAQYVDSHQYREKVEVYTCMRLVVAELFQDCFSGWLDGILVKVDISDHLYLLDLLRVGSTVNLLDAHRSGDLVVPNMVIYEPDYLIDVTALTACIRPYGRHPLNYFLSRLQPRQCTAAILLGNVANDFMDDCVNNGADSDYYQAIQRNFHNNLLDYLFLEGGLPDDFFLNTRIQYDNIRSSVLSTLPSHEVGISTREVVLEPSFICEALGLRGRLDVMTRNGAKLIELKSGKADGEYYGKVQPKLEHVLQMSLYKEILHYNLGLKREEINAFLFYSRYPRFFDERSSATAVRSILNLRNEIVGLERDLREGKFDDYLPLLNTETLNTKQLNDRFYHRYLFPQLQNLLMPLQRLADADFSLEHHYFKAYLTFIYREQFLAKTNDNRPESTRGFARTWTSDVTTKQLSGDILVGLKIRDLKGDGVVERIVFDLPDYGEQFIPNFNIGEMVQCYACPNVHDNVLSQQLVRGNIEQITDHSLTLVLAYSQRRHYFQTDVPYAIEHDSTDMGSSLALKGLYAFLQADADRRALLLGQRELRVDTCRQLISHPETKVRDIVLQAKQARDYFLLVGPPGTGKTNVALYSMVVEFLLSQKAGECEGAILLMAYTNRAVDEICGMLERVLCEYPWADYVRIGSEGNCSPDYRSHLLKEKVKDFKKRPEAYAYLQRCPVVVGTVMTMSNNLNLLQHKKFRVAIIDEASQVLEPQILGLLTAGPAFPFIMIGDYKQLPAVVLQSERQSAVTDEALLAIGLTNLRNSLFERLYIQAKQKGLDFAIAHLTHQGRMHSDICDFVSREFYEGNLFVVGLSHQTEALAFPNSPVNIWERFLSRIRMGFVDIPLPLGTFTENPKANGAEAHCAALVVAAWERLLGQEYAAEKIGIIVPFRAQMGRIKSELRRLAIKDWEKITVDTVECYQGSQREYILFTTTISRKAQLEQLSELHDIEGVKVDRKLNVAITRAKKQFVLIGNRNILKTSSLYRSLIETCVPFQQ